MSGLCFLSFYLGDDLSFRVSFCDSGRPASVRCSLVAFPVFPIFGAASPQTAALPLLFILTVTAIKDGVEDYRRAVLDEEVNTSASTKLGNWKNVNQPKDPRNWFERLLRLNPPGQVTRGVRKLREQDANEGKRIVLAKAGDDGRQSISVQDNVESPTGYGGGYYSGAGGRRLEDIQSVDEHSYPPGADPKASMSSFGPDPTSPDMTNWHGGSGSLTAYQQSVMSRASVGVLDYSKRTTGMARWERTLWKKLEVGDIVLLRENEQVPADIVVLATSDPDNMCYLETKNLDGETNLKPRRSVRGTASVMSEEDAERIAFVLDSDGRAEIVYIRSERQYILFVSERLACAWRRLRGLRRRSFAVGGGWICEDLKAIVIH